MSRPLDGLRDGPEGLVVEVRAKPRGHREAIAGMRDGPPADGAANAAIRRTLASALSVAPSRVELTSGASGRDKRFSVPGLTAAAAARLLAAAVGADR